MASASEFIQFVEVKLNRIDSSSYEDVRPEEVLFFANDALKALTLQFDSGAYSGTVDRDVLGVYLAKLYKTQTELPLVNNSIDLDDTVVFKIKDAEAYVTLGSGTTAEAGWQDTRFVSNERTSTREDNTFLKSYPDTPAYRFINGKITFDVSGFACEKIRYDYLEYPVEITETSVLTYPFLKELEDHTVTLILENLEARRLQTQPAVSRS
ncbi:MAG: hypothetical protein KUG81_01675 [Gammaproteobacteria bacterium]|nr:hypothetical protein [Gammaproteobacteria bacterium]